MDNVDMQSFSLILYLIVYGHFPNGEIIFNVRLGKVFQVIEDFLIMVINSSFFVFVFSLNFKFPEPHNQ